jgi:hypothetical protein
MSLLPRMRHACEFAQPELGGASNIAAASPLPRP